MDNKIIELEETSEGVFEKPIIEEESGLILHARHELDLVLEEAKKDGDEEDARMQRVFNDGIIRVIKAFDECGHSGFSASLAIKYLGRLLRFQPLLPLTLEEDEWVEVGINHHDNKEIKIYQNKRASNVFKQEDKFDGKPYCIDGPDGQVVTLEEYPYSYMGIFDKKEENNEETN